jgi:hypothetical protein
MAVADLSAAATATMNILIYCPTPKAREAVSRHLIDVGAFILLFAETEALVVSTALQNEIKLVVLYDPANIRSIIDLKDFLRSKRRHMRVRILPSHFGQLKEGWRDVINDGLKPIKPRKDNTVRIHPRFNWKPE